MAILGPVSIVWVYLLEFSKGGSIRGVYDLHSQSHTLDLDCASVLYQGPLLRVSLRLRGGQRALRAVRLRLVR